MNNRNTNLDMIKCIACFAVVGLHAEGMTDYTLYYLCGCGVPLFFMVNGYLMLSKDTVNYSYIGRKILQLLKIVFCWNLLIAIPVLLLRHKLVNPFTLSINSLLQKGYLWHFWFFGALLILYLILPPLHRFIKKDLRFHVLTLLILFIICMTDSQLSIASGSPLQASIPQSFRLWIWLFYFTVGGLIPILMPIIRKIKPGTHTTLLILSACLNDFANKRIGYYLLHERLAEYFYDEITSIIFYILLFTLLMRIPLNTTIEKKVVSASSLTMGIFILHPILLTGIRSFYDPARQFEVFAFWIWLTVLSALIVHFMLKIPLVRELFRL